MTVYLLKTTLGTVGTSRLFKSYDFAVFCEFFSLLYKLLYVFTVLLEMGAFKAVISGW